MKNQRRSTSGRREFLLRSGTVVSAMLAPAAAGIAHTETGLSQGSGRLALLEDEAEIRKLYQEYAAGLVARAGEPAEWIAQLRLMQDPAQQAETITIAPDGRSARAQFHCVAQMAVPLKGHGSLLEMARLQGQHSETWWESGVHELDCVRTGSGWKIRSLVYYPLAGADLER